MNCWSLCLKLQLGNAVHNWVAADNFACNIECLYSTWNQLVRGAGYSNGMILTQVARWTVATSLNNSPSTWHMRLSCRWKCLHLQLYNLLVYHPLVADGYGGCAECHWLMLTRRRWIARLDTWSVHRLVRGATGTPQSISPSHNCQIKINIDSYQLRPRTIPFATIKDFRLVVCWLELASNWK